MIITVVVSFLLGLLAFPLVMFIRARRDSTWDDSNITNMYRIIAHIGAHPGDLDLMVYRKSGRKPFWYINKDELSDIVNSRPSAEDYFGNKK